MARTKGSGFKMKAVAYGGPMRKNFPSAFKETDAEFEARMKAQGMTVSPTVDVEGKDTQRDVLAKQAEVGTSGVVKEGMEQSARTGYYKTADEFLARKGDKAAKERLKKLASKSAEVRELYEKNPDMTQAEVDKLMSQR